MKEITREGAGWRYRTFRVSGWLNGERIRRQFKNREDALAEKNVLEVKAANSGELAVRPTRLTPEQLAEAETAVRRLGKHSLAKAVDWFLETYRPPVSEMALSEAAAAFQAARAPHVRAMTLRDYAATLEHFTDAFPRRMVHEITTDQVQAFLEGRKVGPKRFNNLRGDLHAFFEFARASPRRWTQTNPVSAVAKFRIPRGVPEILTAERSAALMAHVEAFAGGALVPYFALALFAGLRPSVDEGELWKLSQLDGHDRLIDLELGVIRLPPKVSKTRSVRQVVIRPNLKAWLERYPLKKFPLRVASMKPLVAKVRQTFTLSDDVTRHTFISMHVGKFKSLGEVALEAGNSEAIIRRHYLNLVSAAEAEAFWAIVPKA